MRFRPSLASSILLVCISAAAVAQSHPFAGAEGWLRNCKTSGSRNQSHYCDIREVRLAAPHEKLIVDGHNHGSGITFLAWDRDEVLVQAFIETWADSRREAQMTAGEVRINTERGCVRAEGPAERRYTTWAVRYTVWVPRRTNLSAETVTGGVQVEGVDGTMELTAETGGISIRHAAGDIRGRTTNGGIQVRLSGETWKGRGLDLRAANGGVVLEIPRDYNAQLETTSERTTLGRGGPLIRLLSTNGGVRIRRS